MADQQRKQAMKRLLADLEELKAFPVGGVSAAPLDEDMLEWHCNFLLEDTVYHMILFFPKNYPYVSPSAEFVPSGFVFTGGATKQGKKGTQVCLSIFSDFAMYHTEWADEKSMGWSPGYTVQTVLLNLVSFMAESQTNWGSHVNDQNKKLAKGYKCKDCGHTYAKPFPPLEDEKPGKTIVSQSKHQIVDYISKLKFPNTKPKSKDELFGYGLIQSGPASRPSLTTPCEFLTGESYFGMKKSVGKVQSILKEELAFFLPVYISKTHGDEIKGAFEETMKALTQVLPSCKRLGVDDMVIKVIPNLMSATVVEFSKGTQHTSDNHLCGYFALHRLLLWAVKIYPGLQKKIDDKLQIFIDDQDMRAKNKCPHIGEWLMLLAASAKYKWQDAADAYLSESWRRNVMWYVKGDAKLGYLDTDKKHRLDNTLQATAVSRKLLAFQVLFLDIAMPKNMTREQIIKRYDDNQGFPTDQMVTQMKQAVDRIEKMKTYDDWFKVLKLPCPSEDAIFKRLVNAVEFSINTKGYHWTFWKDQGGWAAVLKKYPNGTPGWSKRTPDAGKKATDDGDKPSDKGKGKGKKSKAPEPMEVDEPKGKGRKKKKVPTATLR